MIKTTDLTNEIIKLSNEMVLLDNVNLPFTSALLKKGTEKVGSVIVDWKNETLDASRGTSLEGNEITTFQNSARTTDKNICQIIQKAVSVSGTSTAVSIDGISDIFAHELKNRMLESKRDLENFLINGKYTEENGATPREMKGIVSFADAGKIEKATVITIKDLNDMAKKMKQAGTSSQDLMLLCDYNTMDIVSDLFADKTTYAGCTNEFGSPVVKINLTYGSAIVTLVDTMPVDTCILVNMEYLKLAELRETQYQDLSKTGDSVKGFIVMENTLKVLNPNAVQMFHKKV